MTKKPTHLHTTEPKELGPEPADTTGKEIELARDWDQDSIVRAMAAGQHDIIEHELNYLLQRPIWQQPTQKTFGHTFTGIPVDVAVDTLAKCRLDNIPVTYHQEWPLLTDPI